MPKKSFKAAIVIEVPKAEPLSSNHPIAKLKGRVEVREINIEDIIPNEDQPRKYFGEEALNELAENIVSQGVLQPITVKRATGQKFQILLGERRWRACQMAGMDVIPAIVRDESQDETENMLTENMQRVDLLPEEIALGIRKLADNNKTSDISKKLGKPPAYVSKCIRIAALLDNAEVRGLLQELRATRPSAAVAFEHLYEIASHDSVEESVKLLRALSDGKITREVLRQQRPPKTVRPCLLQLRSIRKKLSTDFLDNIKIDGDPKQLSQETELAIAALKTMLEKLESFKTQLSV